MSEQPDILLLSDPGLAERLTGPLPADSFVVQREPFAALEALSERPYAAVVLTAPRPDFGALLAAVRRLQPKARIFALTTPAGEHDLLRADGQFIEDYFIIPPTRSEWRRILDASSRVSERATIEVPAQPTALPTQHLAALIDACGDPDTLAACVERLAADVCGVNVRWSRQDEPRAGAQRLLTLDDEPARVLWADEPLSGNTYRFAWLSAVRGLLPGLATNARRMRSLHRLATTDDLTGAHNRRYFMHFARQLLDRARRQRFRVTLLLYDIDDFKVYNDRFGHAAGDEILRETARLMRQITRKHDVVARVGGDEFAVLFWDAGQPRQPNSQPPRDAYALADRFRLAVNSHQFQSLGPEASGVLTISGGLATFPWDGLTVEDLLRQADDALLHAKRDGKNNIYLVGGHPGQPAGEQE